MTTPGPEAQLLSRALGQDVADVRTEAVGRSAGVETVRYRFRVGGAERSLLFERLAPRAALEAALLPFLARKSVHVPAVHARGIPPPAVPAPRWLLVEDLTDLPSACATDPRLVLEAKLEIETAVAQDGPALRALGVPALGPDALARLIARAAGGQDADEAREAARRLAKWPVALVHGDLTCANAVRTERGAVLRRWGSAHLGCALLDVVRLVADVVERGDAVLGIGLPRTYSERLGILLPTEVLRAAEKLDRLARKHLAAPKDGEAGGN